MQKIKLLLLLYLFSFIPMVTHGNDYLKHSAFVYKAIGDSYRRLGQLGLAISNYEKALIIKKDYSDCNFWIAYIMVQKQLYPQALYKVKLALSSDKNNFSTNSLYYSALFLEIDIYLAKNSPKSTIKVIEKLENVLSGLLKQKNQLPKELFKPYLRYYLGKCYYYKGKIFYNMYQEKKPFTSNVLLLKYKKNEKEIPLFFDKAISNNYKPGTSYYYKHLFYTNKTEEIVKKLKEPLGIAFKETIKQQYRTYALNSEYALKKALAINPNVIIDFNYNKN